MGIIPEDANSPLQEAGGRGEGAAADQAPTGQAMQKLEKRLGRRPPLGSEVSLPHVSQSHKTM